MVWCVRQRWRETVCGAERIVIGILQYAYVSVWRSYDTCGVSKRDSTILASLTTSIYFSCAPPRPSPPSHPPSPTPSISPTSSVARSDGSDADVEHAPPVPRRTGGEAAAGKGVPRLPVEDTPPRSGGRVCARVWDLPQCAGVLIVRGVV